MGTRSLTFVKEGKEKLVCMYRQMDGYPSGHGKELAEFLQAIRLVNGLSVGKNEKVANGMGCLAAQMVAHFKEEPGGIYLESVKTKDAGQDYVYSVESTPQGEGFNITPGPLTVKVKECYGADKVIFCGSVDKFLEFCNKEED